MSRYTSSVINRSIKIRRAAISDLRPWAQMRHALWPSVSAADHLKEIEHLFGKNDFVAFVAEADDKSLVGFCEGAIRPYANGCESSPVPFAEGCWVDDACREQGVGRLLMSSLETWAVEAGFNEIGSDCSIENYQSQEFHQRLGFTETERVVYFRKGLKRE